MAVEKTAKEEDSQLKTEAETKAVLEEAQVQLLKLTALNLQLEKDTERTEKRGVALIEAQLLAEAAKVKNTAEGIHRGIFAYFNSFILTAALYSHKPILLWATEPTPGTMPYPSDPSTVEEKRKKGMCNYYAIHSNTICVKNV